jgi:hypothetical protein
MPKDDAIARLARQIDATKKAEQHVVSPDAVASVRRQGALELHRICAEFVTAVNSRLSGAALDLSPAAYTAELFRDPGPNLFQIGSQGREIQIAFQTPREVVSTEKYPIPYVLEGEVRAYNQRMLERFEIQSRAIFLCVERESAAWRFYDWRTLKTGPVGRDLLAGLMESLF